MLITSADLKTQTKNDLAQMAKRLGVSNWNALSKDQLVAAIVKHKKSAGKAGKAPTSKPAAKGKTATKKAKNAGKSVAAKATSRMTAKSSKPAGKSDTKKVVAKPSAKRFRRRVPSPIHRQLVKLPRLPRFPLRSTARVLIAKPTVPLPRRQPKPKR